MNALQELIAAHCAETGETYADIAARGHLSRQTVSAIAHRDDPNSIPHHATLGKLAAGLGLSVDVVERAALLATSQAHNGDGDDVMHQLRISVLLDHLRELDDKQLRVLTATARAMRRE